MDWGFKHSIFVYAILFFQLVCGGSGSSRKILEMNTHKHSDSISHMGDRMNNPEVNIFFTPDDLKTGKTLQIFFAVAGDPSTSPRLLSREDADSIPFSSAELPHLLERFSFSPSSPQASAMEQTLRHCEFPAMKGETKFCAASLESMLDSVRGILGLGSPIRVMTTEFVSAAAAAAAAAGLRNYTIVGDPREITARKMVGCHSLPYPYAVFYCHSQEGDTRLFEALLVSENGEERVEGVAICHMDTSQWNRDHVSFRVLGIEPGSSPVCHFFPPDNLVWVSSDSHDF